MWSMISLGLEKVLKLIVGLAIIRITKHRLGSKGGPTALYGEPAYKHEYSIIKDL
jgi:hypothetical protein